MRLRSCLRTGLLLGALLLPLWGCSLEPQQQDALESARQAYSIGHFSEAERIYQHYLQAQPEGKRRLEAWNRLLEIAVNVQNDMDKAANLLNSMYLEFGEDPQQAWLLLSRLAEVYEGQRRRQDALTVWKTALALPDLDETRRTEVYLRVARVLRQQQEFIQVEQVLAACEQEIQSPELKATCLYETAQTLEFMLRRAQAQTLEAKDSTLDLESVRTRIEGILQRIRALEGVDEERKAMATFLLADLMENRGDKARARELFASIRETYPNPMVIEVRLKNLQ